MEPLKNAEIVEKVIDFIERKLKSNNCLVELERVFSENYPTYQLIFKEQMGMNIIDYINKARINEAEKLLEKTTLDIKEDKSKNYTKEEAPYKTEQKELFKIGKEAQKTLEFFL